MMLTDQEQSYYGELFQTCDVDGSGKLTGGHVTELFRQSGLPPETLLQVRFLGLCDAECQFKMLI